MSTIRTETTPNPNSLKFTAPDGAFLDDGMAAFSTPDEAQGHPLGEPLFAIDGVDDVFLTPQFVTISKQPSADWADLTPSITDTLQTHLEARG
jgi:hypothetical protein